MAQGGSDPLDGFFMSERELMPSDSTAVPGVSSASLSAADTIGLLSFCLGAEEYALDIADLQEIIRAQDIIELPGAGVCVAGIISLRGTIVPILDLHGVLGLARPPEATPGWLVVLRGGGAPVGLVADRVTGVVRLSRASVEARPGLMRMPKEELVQGIGWIATRAVGILDASAVIALVEGAER